MYRACLFAFLALSVFGCSESPNETTHPASDETKQVSENNTSNLADQSISKSGALFEKVLSKSEPSFSSLKAKTGKLKASILALSKQATKDNLQTAQQDWKEAHNAYLSTRLFRQLAPNLDIKHPQLDYASTSPKLVHTNHSRIDQHPLLPGYLDKVKGYPYSGLIHSEIELSEKTLNEEHLLGDSAYVALGFHAIEFMLFGNRTLTREIEDLNQTSDKKALTAKKRRTLYLKLLSAILKKDIEALASEWNTLDGFYISALASTPEKQLSTSLQQIAEVELEACKQIQAILEQQTDQNVHDTIESITARKNLAQDILKILKTTVEN